jgi:signal peptidase I
MDLHFEKEKNRPDLKKIIIQALIFIVELIVVILLAYLIVHYALERTTIYEESMNPTLVEEDKVLINKFAYRFSRPKRFDVIVFKESHKEHSFYNIKRIIGLPGETVHIRENGIYINDERLEEPIEVENVLNRGLASEPILLEKDEYFVLGDNRNSSEDSRFANVGNVLYDNIIGKAWVRMNEFNFVSKLNLKKEIEVE